MSERSPGPGGGRRRYVPDWPTNIDARRRRLGRWMIIIIAGIALLVVANSVVGGNGDPEGLEQRGSGWFLEDGTETTVVTVERVIDGDTLDVALFGGEVLRVRLFGVDAPEIGEACADEASERLRALDGSEVLLLPDERIEDAGGRQLRYVFTPDQRSLDAALVDEGLAEAWRKDGAFRDQLVDIEDEARDARRGCLWVNAR